MLAYFFYHWKLPSVSGTDYEERLRDFHAALSAAPSEGFSVSWSVALSGIPWANLGGDSYEDWYIVRNSGDLDPLNDAAISASRKVPHDKAATANAGGAAGLYRLKAGQMICPPRFSTWFSKPEQLSYAQLFEQLGPVLQRGGALWQRQMALGPGEFCIHTDERASIPGIDSTSIALRPVFPDAA